jgi:hypothetical protein
VAGSDDRVDQGAVDTAFSGVAEESTINLDEARFEDRKRSVTWMEQGLVERQIRQDE